MFCISVPMILLNVLIAESFGGGDIKLMFVSGIALGWKYSLLAAFIGILLAGSYSIYLLVSKKINKKGHIAFGPYLSIGIFIALSYGSEIISWYRHDLKCTFCNFRFCLFPASGIKRIGSNIQDTHYLRVG